MSRFEPAFEIVSDTESWVCDDGHKIERYVVALTAGSADTTILSMVYAKYDDVYRIGEYDYGYSVEFDALVSSLEEAVDHFRRRVFREMVGVFKWK